METALWLAYGVGVGVWCAFGVILLVISELLQYSVSDRSVLKYLAFCFTWPVTWPVFLIIKWLGYRVTKA